MKLSPSTIAANLSAAAAAEAANSNTNVTSFNNTASATVSTVTSATAVAAAATLSSINSTSTSMNQHQLNPPGKSTPKDTQVIAAILKEMGITEYEPRVLPQLVEFAYRYASRVLEDAQLFSSYAKKKLIDSDDVSIALQMQGDRSFVGPPSRDVLLEIARNKNTQPLPQIKSHNGMRLPADRYSLVASNLRLASGNKTQPSNSKGNSRTGTSLLSKYSNANSKGPSMNHQLSSSTLNSNSPMGSSDAMGVKRRLDET